MAPNEVDKNFNGERIPLDLKSITRTYLRAYVVRIIGDNSKFSYVRAPRWEARGGGGE